MKVFTIIATNEATKYIKYIRYNADILSNLILILDNDVVDLTVTRFAVEYPNVIVAKSEGKNNVYEARNTGIKMALELGAEYILFTDADCLVEPNWENEMVKDGGSILIGWTDEVATRNSALTEHGKRYNLGLGTNGIKFYCSGANVITTCNCGYSREVFNTIGLFPTRMSSDAAFGQLATAAGFNIKLRTDARVSHHIVSTAYELFKKKMRYAKSVISSPLTAPFWILGSLIIALGVLVKAISFKNLNVKNLFIDTWFILMQDLGLGWGRIRQVFKRYKNIW